MLFTYTSCFAGSKLVPKLTINAALSIGIQEWYSEENLYYFIFLSFSYGRSLSSRLLGNFLLVNCMDRILLFYLFKIFFVSVPHLATDIFLNFHIEPELGAGIRLNPDFFL
jgi:hypothetical protein